jgi:uncharacterized protein (TIGR04255 family)
MAQIGQYSKPPLVEALIDFQVTPATGFVTASLAACHDPVRADYPLSQPLRLAFGHFMFGEQVSAAATAQDIGYRFAAADGLKIFLARPDGFTHNRLAPYPGWEPFRSEARRLWSVYRDVARPVAVRYINRLDIPLPAIELKDYLRTVPEISPDLSQGVAQFFMQVTLPAPAVGGLVTLTETVAVPQVPGTTSLVFDLDLYRTEQLPQDEDGLWNLLERFRDEKDAIFEACITDKTRELIQ